MSLKDVGFQSLDRTTQLQIFAKLPIKDTLNAGAVCKGWSDLAEDPSLWVSFAKLITLTHNTKSSMIDDLKLKKIATKSDNPSEKREAEVVLSCLGLNVTSFKDNVADPEKINQLCNSGIELLSKGQLGEARKIYDEVTNIQLSSGKIVHEASGLNDELMMEYVREGKLKKAFQILPMFGVLARSRLIFLMEAAKKANNIDLIFSYLPIFKSLDSWNACAWNFKAFLEEKRDLANLEKLNSLYPEIYTSEEKRESDHWFLQYHNITSTYFEKLEDKLNLPRFL